MSTHCSNCGFEFDGSVYTQCPLCLHEWRRDSALPQSPIGPDPGIEPEDWIDKYSPKPEPAPRMGTVAMLLERPDGGELVAFEAEVSKLPRAVLVADKATYDQFVARVREAQKSLARRSELLNVSPYMAGLLVRRAEIEMLNLDLIRLLTLILSDIEGDL